MLEKGRWLGLWLVHSLGEIFLKFHLTVTVKLSGIVTVFGNPHSLGCHPRMWLSERIAVGWWRERGMVVAEGREEAEENEERAWPLWAREN